MTDWKQQVNFNIITFAKKENGRAVPQMQNVLTLRMFYVLSFPHSHLLLNINDF